MGFGAVGVDGAGVYHKGPDEGPVDGYFLLGGDGVVFFHEGIQLFGGVLGFGDRMLDVTFV